MVTFEADSKLSWIAPAVFWDCFSLSSIRIPASLRGVLSEYGGLLTITGPGIGREKEMPVQEDEESSSSYEADW
jgi:hypothetical protein